MANNKDTSVVEVPTSEEAQGHFDSALPAIADTNLIAIAEESEKRLEALNKIKKVALKLTNPNDWVDENGKPYLQASGGEKVARLFGMSWRIFEPTEEDLGSGHFLVTYRGEFALGGAIITAIGTRSSKDAFFKKYKYAGEQRVELPASEIDKGDVKKAAYTNLLANGITRLLGIRNLTWDDLKEFAGITQDKVTSVTFKKGGKAQSSPGKAPSSTSKAEPSMKDQIRSDAEDLVATMAQAQAIHAILKSKGIEDELSKMQEIQRILGLKEAPTSIGKLTKSKASKVIAALQKEGEDVA